MRLSVIYPDNMVIKDGVGFEVALPAWPGAHAIQWADARGEVEFVDGNEEIDDPALIQPFIDLWQAAYDAAHPAPTFESRKADTLATVYEKSGEVFEAGFRFDFGKAGVRRLDCRNADDKVNWFLLLDAVRELITAKIIDEVLLIDADNNIFAAAPEVVEAALVAMRAWGFNATFKARRVKDAVLAAPDDDALAKIDVAAALASEAAQTSTPGAADV